MASLDKEIKVIAVKGERGYSSYEEAVANDYFSGTLEEWIETYATPENYVTRDEFKKVTQAEYDALEQAGELIPNCYYIITDDTTYDELINRIEALESDVTDNTNDITDIKDDITDINNDIDNINQRLDDLGFSEGVFSVSEGTPATNWIKKQGKYVRGSLVLLTSINAGASKTITITVPSAYKPKANTLFIAGISMSNTSPQTAPITKIYANALLSPDGTLNVTFTNSDTYLPKYCTINLSNIGWEIN